MGLAAIRGAYGLARVMWKSPGPLRHSCALLEIEPTLPVLGVVDATDNLTAKDAGKGNLVPVNTEDVCDPNLAPERGIARQGCQGESDLFGVTICFFTEMVAEEALLDSQEHCGARAIDDVEAVDWYVSDECLTEFQSTSRHESTFLDAISPGGMGVVYRFLDSHLRKRI